MEESRREFTIDSDIDIYISLCSRIYILQKW